MSGFVVAIPNTLILAAMTLSSVGLICWAIAQYARNAAESRRQAEWPCQSGCVGNPCSVCGFSRRETQP